MRYAVPLYPHYDYRSLVSVALELRVERYHRSAVVTDIKDEK
jgi:hypothetical protein